MPQLKTIGITLALLLALCGPASARGTGIRLDPTFGTGGRVTVPAPSRYYPLRAAGATLMSDGGLLVPTGQSLLLVGPDGRVDESFGTGGTLALPVAAGTSFEIAGVAVDAQGRILVAGTSDYPPEERSAGEPFAAVSESPRAARVMRFLPGGTLDQSFADHGVLETTFGLPPPLDSTGKPIVARTWADATGVSVDAQGRVLVTGGASAGVEFGCAHDWFWNTVTYAALVARLTPSGGFDTGFGGGDGVFGGRSSAENPLNAEIAADPIPGPGGEVTYGSGGARCPRAGGELGLAQLASDGTPQASVGPQGRLPGWFTSTVPGPDGSTLALGPLASKGNGPRRVQVVDIGADGKPGGSFGGQARVVAAAPGPVGSELVSVAGGPEGGVLLGGTLRREAVRGAQGRGRFLITRLDADGRIDPRFGRSGRVVTGFPGLTVRGKKLLLDGGGHALLVGSYRRGARGASGLAVARYVLGRSG